MSEHSPVSKRELAATLIMLRQFVLDGLQLSIVRDLDKDGSATQAAVDRFVESEKTIRNFIDALRGEGHT